MKTVTRAELEAEREAAEAKWACEAKCHHERAADQLAWLVARVGRVPAIASVMDVEALLTESPCSIEWRPSDENSSVRDQGRIMCTILIPSGPTTSCGYYGGGDTLVSSLRAAMDWLERIATAHSGDCNA